jgi:two-component system, sensor histidine kinase and response regulator
MKALSRDARSASGRPWRAWAWRPSTIAVAYAAAASLWILVSDRIVRVSVGRPGLAETFDSLKGLAFVAITSAVLYLLLRHLGRDALARRVLPTTVFDSAGFGIAIADARSNRLIAVNRAFAQARQRQAGEFSGRPAAPDRRHRGG